MLHFDLLSIQNAMVTRKFHFVFFLFLRSLSALGHLWKIRKCQFAFDLIHLKTAWHVNHFCHIKWIQIEERKGRRRRDFKTLTFSYIRREHPITQTRHSATCQTSKKFHCGNWAIHSIKLMSYDPEMWSKLNFPHFFGK